MLQEIAYNGAHRDIFAQSRHACAQAADAPDHQLHLHPGVAGLIQGCDDLLVAEGIHLCHNVGLAPGQGVLRLPADHAQAAGTQPQGSHGEPVPGQRLGVTGQHVEHRRGILADLGAAG